MNSPRNEFRHFNGVRQISHYASHSLFFLAKIVVFLHMSGLEFQ